MKKIPYLSYNRKRTEFRLKIKERFRTNYKKAAMKKFIMLSIILTFMLQGNVFSIGKKAQGEKQENDSSNYTTVTGKIIDQNSKAPVVFASVYKTGTSIGTVTNSDGEFMLKIPGKSAEGTVSISFIGYKNITVSIVGLINDPKKAIILEPYAVPIDEVVIKSVDPVQLLRTALDKVKENYPLNPEMQTGFYRETIKQNKNYVSISEAILDIYNSGYREGFNVDKVKIYKGRKSKDVKKMDTVLVKFQGGPRTAMFLDIIKNPSVILDAEMFDYYNYSIAGKATINNRDNYIIEFSEKIVTNFPLYQGKFYIDVEKTAISGVDFRIGDKSLEKATSVLVKKKPMTMKLDVISGNYLVNYREIDNKWVLNYVRSEIAFKAKWDKKFFKSTITTMFEMAITDRQTENIEKIPTNEAVKFNDVFAEQVDAFEDDDYWGEYNVIKPDESIEVAIKKMYKQLKK